MPCKPTMWQMPDILNVNDFVVATDLQPSQTYTAGNFATPRGSTASEIKMNNEVWVTHRNQLTLWQVENTATTSIQLSLKTHTYKISRHVQNPTFERPIEQSTKPIQENSKAPEKTASESEACANYKREGVKEKIPRRRRMK